MCFFDGYCRLFPGSWNIHAFYIEVCEKSVNAARSVVSFTQHFKKRKSFFRLAIGEPGVSEMKGNGEGMG